MSYIQMTIAGIIGQVLWAVIGAVVAYAYVKFKDKYSGNAAVSAMIEYFANAIADVDNRFARAMKLDSPNHKLNPDQVISLEQTALDTAIQMANNAGDNKIVQMLQSLSPAEVSKYIKEVKCERFGG